MAHNARRLLAYGVTTVRNPGGDMAASRAYDEARAAGLPGPEALQAGEVIDRSPFPVIGLADRPSETRGAPPSSLNRRKAARATSSSMSP
ncbi:hypothetical protein [Brevundimonas denitrificans]|uniref:hypothetical protein n=1 Tax=Brevundimonas denitrificans TaxID=1443434 RepID=UPI00223AD783|nr:hypothetical protein [Brevundimonas denitrificans]